MCMSSTIAIICIDKLNGSGMQCNITRDLSQTHNRGHAIRCSDISGQFKY